MAKVQIQHPTNERICEFVDDSPLTVATNHGMLLVAENLGSTVRIILTWEEVAKLLAKTIAKLEALALAAVA
jgi:ribulose-5-phosphate 4-epimerase/fuculose-1-phosphate aldolase